VYRSVGGEPMKVARVRYYLGNVRAIISDFGAEAALADYAVRSSQFSIATCGGGSARLRGRGDGALWQHETRDPRCAS
jgi:hypothetical protein